MNCIHNWILFFDTPPMNWLAGWQSSTNRQIYKHSIDRHYWWLKSLNADKIFFLFEMVFVCKNICMYLYLFTNSIYQRVYGLCSMFVSFFYFYSFFFNLYEIKCLQFPVRILWIKNISRIYLVIRLSDWTVL